MGVSLIDADAALTNRLGEVDGTLESVAESAADAWRAILSGVRIAGGTERQQTIFFSALHNAYRMPSRLSEPDGRYRGFDGEVHSVADPELDAYYSDLSMWDTYRTLHPWYSLTNHDLQRDCLR